jgi:redox-sensitive bicupin YhaK (pirin superfamily)
MTVVVEIRRGTLRFSERAPGRATWHSLAFGADFDPGNLAFGPMACHDEHLLAAGAGFDTHRHSGLTIVTWVLSGALGHTSSLGEDRRVAPGEVAVLMTGDGVEHAEHAVEKATRFVQVWLSGTDPEPSYAVSAATPTADFSLVTSPRPGARFYVANPVAGQTLSLPTSALAHLFVASGALMRSSLADPLATGDAFRITDEPSVSVTTAVDSQLLLWAFDDVGDQAADPA